MTHFGKCEKRKRGRYNIKLATSCETLTKEIDDSICPTVLNEFHRRGLPI